MKWIGMNSIVPEAISKSVGGILVCRLTEFSVDSADELVDNSAQVLILLDILTTGDGNLNKNDLANPLGMLSQEHLEGVQFLRDALDVVKTIDTDNQLHALELALQHSNTVLDFGLLQTLLEFFRINADWKRADGDDLALELDAVRSGSEAPVSGVSNMKLGFLHKTYNILEQLLKKWRA